MASIKNLKKDINFLIDEVIGTCLIHQFTRQGNSEELDAIIFEMVEFRESLISRINNPDLNGSAEGLKNFYKLLLDELLEKVNNTFDRLNKIAG